jgi:triosephosphate isomerase
MTTLPFICAGNWKMNMNAEQAATFVRQFKTLAPNGSEEHFLLLPPALVAWQVAAELKGTGFAWGGQNCYSETKGAFTGENSPQTLFEMGARHCLVGHSERRHVFGEPDEMLAKKVHALQKLEMTPILCVGETLDDRRWNRTQEVIVRQLRTALQAAEPQKSLWIAYEPVWAIGTGLVATPDQVDEAHVILRKALREWNSPASEAVPILYGGSVKADNVKTLAGLKDVNGFLIGGASLDPSEFTKIYQVALDARHR